MNTAEFFGALAAVVIGVTAQTVTIVAWLGSRLEHRIDRLEDRLIAVKAGQDQLHEDFVLHSADRNAH